MNAGASEYAGSEEIWQTYTRDIKRMKALQEPLQTCCDETRSVEAALQRISDLGFTHLSQRYGLARVVTNQKWWDDELPPATANVQNASGDWLDVETKIQGFQLRAFLDSLKVIGDIPDYLTMMSTPLYKVGRKMGALQGIGEDVFMTVSVDVSKAWVQELKALRAQYTVAVDQWARYRDIVMPLVINAMRHLAKRHLKVKDLSSEMDFDRLRGTHDRIKARVKALVEELFSEDNLASLSVEYFNDEAYRIQCLASWMSDDEILDHLRKVYDILGREFLGWQEV